MACARRSSDAHADAQDSRCDRFAAGCRRNHAAAGDRPPCTPNRPAESRSAWFPPGTFTRQQDSPPVVIEHGFYRGVYPVTRGQSLAVMGYNRSHFQGKEYPEWESRPAEMVNWEDCRVF